MGNTKHEGGTGLLDKLKDEVKEPPKYRVVLHNDDYTPMDFVVAILVQVFRYEQTRAVRIMLDVHTKGRGIAGVYTREIAEMKMAQTLSYAKQHENPLEVSIEPEA